MRRFPLALVVVAIPHLATAADLPLKAPPAPVVTSPWNGFYVGGNIGYGWGGDTGGGWSSTTILDLPAYFDAGGNVLPNVKPRGVVGGVQIGYNFQVAPSVLAGWIADIQFSDIDGEASVTVTPPPGNTAGRAESTQSKFASIDWFGTLRAKLGVTQGNFLTYGTGGLAYGRVKQTVTFVCVTTCLGTLSGTDSDVKTGWAAGAGFEYKINPRWSVGAEYLHIDLGKASATAVPVTSPSNFGPGDSISASSKFTADIVRATLNYHF